MNQQMNPMQIMQQFQQFKQQNMGQDPQQLLNQLMQSGKLSQDRLNWAQNMAQQFKQFM